MRIGSAIASGARHVVGVSLQALLMAAIITALVFAAAAVSLSAPAGGDSVFAAKGGNGRGGGASSTTTSAWLAASPHAASVGETFAISGAGFNPASTTYLLVKKPSSTTFLYATVAADGTLSASAEVWETGRTLIEAYQFGANGSSHLVASCDVDVR